MSEKEVFQLRRRNGKIVAFCNICMTTIATGETHKGLNFIKQHMASQTHKTNLEIVHCRESEIPLSIQTIQREIDEQFLQQFIRRKKSVVCCTCTVWHRAASIAQSCAQQHKTARQQCKPQAIWKCNDKRYFHILHQGKEVHREFRVIQARKTALSWIPQIQHCI